MDYQIKGYEPVAFFHHFEEISAIPRGSGNEEAISAFLVDFAEKNGLSAYRDAVFNVVIEKPASAGYENAPAVMLQGHTDMVCEKNVDTVHDFLTEGIKLVQEGDILRADGTTLGADNGVAVALMMTILEDKTLCHPKLTCVFTVQEETGLTGAKELDGSKIDARLLINLDSGGLGHATVSCAGGMRVRMRRDANYVSANQPALHIAVRGLQGGHSGVQIHLGRGNANKLMGRMLFSLREAFPELTVSSIAGGSKDNAIPRECDAVAAFTSQEDLSRAEEIIRAIEQDIKAELAESDPGFFVKVEPCTAERVMEKNASDALVSLLYLAPNGVCDRNEQAGGFVVRSLNLGVIYEEDGKIVLVFAPRSSVASLQEETRKTLCFLADTFGFSTEIGEEYPGWAYNPDSPLRRLFCEVWKEQTGEELCCEAIHAGLECGLFTEKLPGLDAIAVGVDESGAHTPQESLDMTTVRPIYDLVCGVLKKMK